MDNYPRPQENLQYLKQFFRPNDPQVQEHMRYLNQFVAIGSSYARSLKQLIRPSKLACFPGASLSGNRKNIKAVILSRVRNFKKVIIWCGANDLVDDQIHQIRHQLKEKFLQDIQEILNTARETQDHQSRLIYILLPPRHPENKELQKEIRKVNREIIKLLIKARKTGTQTSWVDLHSLAKDPENFKPDGIHFTYEGNRQLTMKIVKDTLNMQH